MITDKDEEINEFERKVLVAVAIHLHFDYYDLKCFYEKIRSFDLLIAGAESAEDLDSLRALFDV